MLIFVPWVLHVIILFYGNNYSYSTLALAAMCNRFLQ